MLNKITGWRSGWLTLAAAALVLSACGGPGGGETSTTTPQPATEALTISINQTTVADGVPATVSASLTKGGVPVANEIVVFTTDSKFGSFSPVSGSVLTDAGGVARITMSAGSSAGASVVTATSRSGTSAATNYLVLGTGSGGGNADTLLSLAGLSVATNPLSAYGTTSVAVTVNATTAGSTSVYQVPVDVTFSSSCASRGKAQLTATATTVNGVATAQYKDNGCNGPDTITATLTGAASASAALTVQSPALGSIQFVGASPTTIALKGTGGAGLQETSLVQFKIVDQAGNPIAASVQFSLSTSVGGLALTSTQASSDAQTGIVSTNVVSGSVATPVRVTASVLNSTISTQSDKLSVSTGLPDQAHFSLATTVPNIEGWDYDGVTTQLTVRMADHFSNPIPDGTVVNFIAEGASVQSSCSVTEGVCQVTFTSQALRPTDGRVSVLAYAIGEEAFIDLNGDGYISETSEFRDANGTTADLPEAFVDFNENGLRDSSSELFVDFDSDGVYDAADGAYNGVLCKSGGTVTCSARKSLHVRDNEIIVLSGSFWDLSASNPGFLSLPTGVQTGSGFGLNLAGCGGIQEFRVLVRDVNGNVMPAGTTVSIKSDNGEVVGETSYIVAASISRPTAYNYSFFIKGDGKLENGACKDETNAGSATITVSTPRGNKTALSVPVVN